MWDNFTGDRGRLVARVGIFFATAPFWGGILMVLGLPRMLLRALQTGNHRQAEHGMDFLVWVFQIGAGLGVVGAGMMLWALWLGNREKWFFWAGVVTALLFCQFYFPYGWVVGVILLVPFLLMKAWFVD